MLNLNVCFFWPWKGWWNWGGGWESFFRRKLVLVLKLVLRSFRISKLPLMLKLELMLVLKLLLKLTQSFFGRKLMLVLKLAFVLFLLLVRCRLKKLKISTQVCFNFTLGQRSNNYHYLRVLMFQSKLVKCKIKLHYKGCRNI